jgi:hypothetical protein
VVNDEVEQELRDLARDDNNVRDAIVLLDRERKENIHMREGLKRVADYPHDSTILHNLITCVPGESMRAIARAILNDYPIGR